MPARQTAASSPGRPPLQASLSDSINFSRPCSVSLSHSTASLLFLFSSFRLRPHGKSCTVLAATSCIYTSLRILRHGPLVLNLVFRVRCPFSSRLRRPRVFEIFVRIRLFRSARPAGPSEPVFVPASRLRHSVYNLRFIFSGGRFSVRSTYPCLFASIHRISPVPAPAGSGERFACPRDFSAVFGPSCR